MKKKKIIALTMVTVFLGLFFVIPEARAEMEWPAKLLGGILGQLISAVGLLLVLVIKALVFVASYSNFINSGAVTYGWIMVRDLCNMFFVVVLLIIAFGTILNIESYNYKKWLPKLIMMAILINFSKTICGLLIDVSQVVMLTFVNSFKSIGGANMTTILGIDSILMLDKESPDASFWQVVGAYMLGLIYIVIALIVISTMMAMLVMRIVMIWIYVVLSPLAYLLAAFPGGQSYSSKWWSQFTQNLIVGPVLAFFIWLSLAALNADQISEQEQQALNEAAAAEGGKILDVESSNLYDPNSSDNTAVAMTKSSTPSALIKFVIAIGMLLGGLKISQEIGGAAGSIAGKGMAAVNKAKNIGLAGVAGATGYTYAKNVAKRYGAMRQSNKEAKYQLGAEKLAGGVGAVKKTVGTFTNKALDSAKSRIGLNRAGDKAKAFNEEAQNKRQQIADMQKNLNRKDGKIDDWVYNKDSKKWQNSSTGANMKHEDMAKMVSKKTERLKAESETASKAAAVQAKKQQRTDKWVKTGLITAGVGLGLLTGGLPGAAILGGGVAGAYSGKKKLATMGDYDLSKGSSWRDNQVKADMDNLKDEDDEEVITRMDDPSLDKFSRIAAAMEAMSRGLLSSEEAQRRKDQIKSDIGTDDKGDIKDKKIAARFEALAKTNNVSATKKYEDLRSSDPEKRNKAEQSIVREIETGRMNIDALDSGAIKQIGASLVSFMKPKEFAKQFSAISDPGKKNDLLSTIRDEANADTSSIDTSTPAGKIAKENAEFQKIEAMKKIARVKTVDDAVGMSGGAAPTQVQQEQRTKVLQSFVPSELSDIFTGDDEDKKESIANTLNIAFVAAKNKNPDKSNAEVMAEAMEVFSKDAQTFLNGTSSLAVDIRKQLGITTMRNTRQTTATSANRSNTSNGVRPNITQNMNNPQPGNNTTPGGFGPGPIIT